MLHAVRAFLNRPITEDFSAETHVRLALQAGLYVFLFVGLLNGSFRSIASTGVTALLAVGCVGAVVLANVVVPKVLPAFYDEDCWTVGRHGLHNLFVLFLISTSNQLILNALDAGRPSFGQMYLTVTLIGFFPIALGVFVAEQRRLKRNLAHAQTLNQRLDQRSETAFAAPSTPVATVPPVANGVPAKPLLLVSENGKERLSIQTDQLLYVESVGNYVDVHWLTSNQVSQRITQKTMLRSTLKEIETALAGHPRFLRCHRAFVVNLAAVSHTEGNARGYQLTLTGTETTVPVSRSYLAAFDARLSAVR